MIINKELLEKIHNDFFEKAKYTNFSRIEIQPMNPPSDRIFYIQPVYEKEEK